MAEKQELSLSKVKNWCTCRTDQESTYTIINTINQMKVNGN